MTQHDEILEYIDRNGSITMFEAFDKLHITKCNTRISELRKAGFNIDDKWETSVSADGKVTRYKRYFRGDEVC